MTQAVRTTNALEAEHRRELSIALNQILLGRINTVGDVTLANGTTTTTIDNPEIKRSTRVFLTPQDANGQGITFYTVTTDGTVTINHDAPTGDAVFAYVLLG